MPILPRNVKYEGIEDVRLFIDSTNKMDTNFSMIKFNESSLYTNADPNNLLCLLKQLINVGRFYEANEIISNIYINNSFINNIKCYADEVRLGGIVIIKL